MSNKEKMERYGLGDEREEIFFGKYRFIGNDLIELPEKEYLRLVLLQRIQEYESINYEDPFLDFMNFMVIRSSLDSHNRLRRSVSNLGFGIEEEIMSLHARKSKEARAIPGAIPLQRGYRKQVEESYEEDYGSSLNMERVQLKEGVYEIHGQQIGEEFHVATLFMPKRGKPLFRNVSFEDPGVAMDFIDTWKRGVYFQDGRQQS